MADPTEAQLKEAARKALAAGNTASAKRLIEAARKAGAAAAQAPVSNPLTPPTDASGNALGPVPAPRADAVGAPPVAAPPQDSLIDTIMGGAGYLAQETTRGFTNMLGAPVDLLNVSPMLLNVLPGVSGVRSMTDEAARLIDGEYPAQTVPPIGGGQSAYDVASAPRDLLQYIFDGEVSGDQTTNNPYLRIAGRAANEIGAALIPAGGALAAAGRMGVQGARNMGGPVGDIVESAAVNPTNFATKELAVSGGAGAGAGVAREMASDGDPSTVTPGEAAADILGALFGGVATQGTIIGAGAARDFAGAVTGRGGSDMVKQVVANEIGTAAGAPEVRPGVTDTSGLATLLSGAKRVGDTIPGFIESTGDVLKNAGVQALEYGRQSGPNAGLYSQRRSQNVEAVDTAIEGMAPDATPGAFREPLAANRDAALAESSDTATAAQEAFEVAAQRMEASMSGEARGQTIRGALDEAKVAARAVEREAWSAVSGEVDPAPLVQAFEDVTNRLPIADGDLVSTINNQLSTPARIVERAKGGLVDLEEITSLRSSLSEAWRVASANGQDNQARIIKQYLDTVDGFLDEIPRLAEPLKAARQTSKDLNDRFTRRGTPVADALATRPSGGPVAPDSSVAGKFVQPDEGQASNVNRLLRETASVSDNAILDPTDAKNALADEIKAGAQPFLNKPDRLEGYLKQYDSVFAKFPELKAELGSVANLRRAADEAMGNKAATEARLGAPGKPGSSAVAKYLQYGDERAVDAMAGVVNAKDPKAAIDELLSFAGTDPQTIEGARSAFWQLMRRDAKSSGATTKTAAGEQPWRPASLYNFLTDPKRAVVAERLYADNPEHLANLRGIAEELRGVDLRTSAKAPNTSGTPQSLQGNAILPSTETLASRSFAIQRGQVGLAYTGVSLASVMAKRAQMIGKGKEYQTLLDKALLDPKVAEFLMTEYNPANAAAMARTAKSFLGVRSAWVDEALVGSDTGDEDEEMTNTIMDGFGRDAYGRPLPAPEVGGP